MVAGHVSENALLEAEVVNPLTPEKSPIDK